MSRSKFYWNNPGGHLEPLQNHRALTCFAGELTCEQEQEVSFEKISFYEVELKVSFEKIDFYEVKLKVSREKINFYEVKLKVTFEKISFLRGIVEGWL